MTLIPPILLFQVLLTVIAGAVMLALYFDQKKRRKL